MHQSKDADSKDEEWRREEICLLTNQPSSYAEQQGMVRNGAFVGRVYFSCPIGTQEMGLHYLHGQDSSGSSFR